MGKEKSALFQQSYAEVAELEREVVALGKEETVRLRQITEVSSQRERMSREAAKKVNKLRETKEYVKVKDLVTLDLKKKRKEMQTKVRLPSIHDSLVALVWKACCCALVALLP